MPLFTSELSYSDDYPTIEPSLRLDFANARALDPRITFTRASTATYVGRDGLIKTAGEDEARFDHDFATGESLGLLIEESRTNLALESEDWGNTTYWHSNGNKGGLNGSSNYDYFIATNNTTDVLSPDGANNSVKLAGDTSYTSSGYARGRVNIVTQSITLSQNTEYTFSLFIKDPNSVLDSNQILYIMYGSIFSNTNANAAFDLQNDTVSYNGDYTSSTPGSIKSYPNGWKKLTATFTNTASGGKPWLFISETDNFAGPNTFSTNGESFYAFGFQIEEATFPTSYIPTSGSTATRAAEQAYMTGESFSSWYNPTEGSVVTAFNPTLYVGATDGGRAFKIDHQTISDNRIDYVVTAAGTYQPYVAINGVAPTGFSGINGTTFVVGTDYKISVGFAANDYVAYKNGSQTLSSTTPASVPIADRLSLGLELNGHRKFFYYYPKRLTNTQLQTLTQ